MKTTLTAPRPPLTSPVDVLLADVAIRIQLSRTDYAKAVQRYGAINDWIERPDSPLRDRVEIFYPQGSMAIGSTTASRLRTDEFDIDVVAQLDLPPDITPGPALNLLHAAIRGEPGSRYYRMAKRRTRCVTVDYSDNMHLDVTPMLRRSGTPERESELFHHRPEAPYEPGQRCVANPYGFADWFNHNTPLDQDFAAAYTRLAYDYERMTATVAAKADTEPVPAQTPPFRKSRAVIVLQLLKRWRNVRYDVRSARRPPSIMISKLVADAANHSDGLVEELLHQARHLLSELDRWHGIGLPILVVNPVCPEDVFSDRWPESLAAQGVFIKDLQALVVRVERLVSGCPLDEMKRIMIELFGEAPTAEVFLDYVRRQGTEIASGRSRHAVLNGRLVPAGVAVGSAALPPGTMRTPRHTFYGGGGAGGQ